MSSSAETIDAAALDGALIAETLSICRVPSPTFAEEERAKYIASRLRDQGLREVEVDALHNVTALLPGTGSGPTIMVVAHIDTVFPPGIDVEPHWDGRHWRAPGIRDNSASAAITLLLPQLLRSKGLALRGDLILAFSVGEEGLGNLRGITALMERYRARLAAVLAVDGNLGDICHIGITVRRLEVTATTEGGHSWGDAGKPSAVHVLARIASEISRLAVPTEPKTVVNIGVFNGGTSVNAIAQNARFLLDLRSVERMCVVDLEVKVRAIITAAGENEGVKIETTVIGDRPGGRIASGHPLVKAIEAGYRKVGVSGRLVASSTDANIPLSLGIPAASIGVSRGGGIHTLEEYLDPATLPLGAQALVTTLVALQYGSLTAGRVE